MAIYRPLSPLVNDFSNVKLLEQVVNVDAMSDRVELRSRYAFINGPNIGKQLVLTIPFKKDFEGNYTMDDGTKDTLW